MHYLPREDEELINDMLREYKTLFDIVAGEIRGGKISKSKKLELNFDDKDYISVPLVGNEKEKGWEK